MSEDSIRGEVVTMDDSEMRKSDHKRLMRLERRVDHSIVLLETLTRQMADMMLSFKTGNKQTRGRIRTGSHGSYHSSFKRGLTTTESAGFDLCVTLSSFLFFFIQILFFFSINSKVMERL